MASTEPLLPLPPQAAPGTSTEPLLRLPPPAAHSAHPQHLKHAATESTPHHSLDGEADDQLGELPRTFSGKRLMKRMSTVASKVSGGRASLWRPSADTVFSLTLGNEHPYRFERRLSCRASACRLLSRGPMCAQHGQRRKANVVRQNRDLSLFLQDGYHMVLEVPWQRFLLVFFMTYIVSFVFFACIYRLVSTKCNLDCRSFSDALFLSVETMMTIGYGVPDPFFKSCPWLVAVIIAQCFFGALLDSSLLGIIYQRISAGGRRSATILFSDKAVIRTLDGAHYFMFQVCELRALQLVESHVRLYLYTRPYNDIEMLEDVDETPIAMFPMRLEQPDDSLGATLLLAFPTTVVHRIDAWSPLRGNSAFCGGAASEASLEGMALGTPSRFVPAQRTSEADAGGRNSVWCEACGETFARVEQLRRHVEYNARRAAGADRAHSALLERLPSDPMPQEVRQQIRSFLQTRFVELIVIIEGIDPVTSSNVQARHSYIANDIAWDCHFAECVEDTILPSGEAGVLIDFKNFHTLVHDTPSVRVKPVSP